MSARELKQVFAATDSINDDELLEKLSGLCKLYNLSADRLHSKWEAFQMESSGCQVKMDPSSLDSFRVHLRLKAEQQANAVGLSHKKAKGPLLSKSTLLPPSSGLLALDKNSFGKMISKKSASGSSSNVNSSFGGFAAGDGMNSQSPVAVSSKSMMAMDVDSPSSQRVDSSLMFSPSTLAYSQVTESKFHMRKNPGGVEYTFNESLPAGVLSIADSKNCRAQIAAYDGSLLQGYKFMYDKVGDRCLAVDKRMLEMEQVIASDNVFENEIGHPGQASQFDIKCVGKIMSESSAKLNDKSVMLQTPLKRGAECVRLVLDGVTNFSLFPGQIVGVEGVNNTGRDQFHVRELIEAPIPDSEYTSLSRLYMFNHGKQYMDGHALRVLIAAGPFSVNTDSELDFTPFQEFSRVMHERKPDVVILAGPFVSDSALTSLQTSSPFDVFRDRVLEPLLLILNDIPSLQIVLIPSCRDLIHPWCVFPQSPFNIREMYKAFLFPKYKHILPRLICLPNPCTFAINECCFAFGNDDLLTELSKEEISRFKTDGVNKERVLRLSKHILQQRSFYPIIPAGVNETLPVDYSHLEYAKLNVSPDVLILPSKLSIFSKVVEKTLVINPGVLTRGATGGTFVSMTIHPLPADNFPDTAKEAPSLPNEDSDEAVMLHAVDARARVEIIRI